MESKVEKLVLQLFEIEAIRFGDFKLKSGVQSPIYFDLRIIISHPKLMEYLANLLVEVIQDSFKKKFQHVCGVPYTALPFATLVSTKTQTPMLMRRREAKDHGTKKIIEGHFQKGDECIVVEDVVSSGSSILETVKDLEKEGLKVSTAIVVLDRQQGGVENLKNQGINIQVLFSISQVLKILLTNQKITEEVMNNVEEYISKVKLFDKGISLSCKNGTNNNRLKMKFGDRAKLTKNELGRKLFEIIESKKSLLCLAADVTSTSQLLELASKVGPHICILKTHFDLLEDFSKNTCIELMKLAKNLNFLIMEDRKFSDIGNTVGLQYNQIKTWADLVTVHTIAGEEIVKTLKSFTPDGVHRGCFLVAELSCEGNLITREYTNETAKMAKDHSEFVVGLVCQSPDLIDVPHLIQLTPGVKIEKGSDGLGQSYYDPEYVVSVKGADVAVVGRGITSSSHPEKTAIMYKEKLWKAYERRTEL